MFDLFRYHQKGRDPMYKIWHATDKNSFIYIHSGEGSIVFSNRIYPIKKGALCFIPAEKQHYTMPDRFENYDRSKISFTNGFITAYLQAHRENENSSSSVLPVAPVYSEIPASQQGNVEKLWDIMNGAKALGENRNTLYGSCISALFAYLSEYASENESVYTPYDTAADAAAYINRHIDENIGIDDICRHVNLSKYYFCRRFKSVTGTTVMNYILNTRLSKAKEMLVSGNAPIGEISEACGFSSPAYFSHVFFRSEGMTASAYRKSLAAARYGNTCKF